MVVHWGEFLGIVAVITVVPGPDTTLVIRNAVRRGRAAGLLTAIGCTLGLTTWAVAASVGLGTLLAVSASLFAIVRLAGAIYLVVLGLRLLWSGWRTVLPGPVADDAGRHAEGIRARLSAPPSTVRGALFEGLVADLLNPKAAAFFTALLPQFVAAGDPIVSTVALGLVAAVSALVGFTAYALLAARAGDLLRRRWPAAVLDTVTGLVMLAFGVALVRRAPGLGRTPVPLPR